MQVPDEFICPISTMIMRDPVTTRTGRTYDRASLENWFRQDPRSPTSRQPLTMADLIPNRAMKSVIEDWIQRTGYVEEDAMQTDQVQYRLISIIPKKAPRRMPIDVRFVIDISGSMGNSAAINTGNGVEEFGLSLLDIAKHAVRTCINILCDDDVFSIIAYTTRAKMVIESIKADSPGKALGVAALDSLVPEDTTNIWDGLKMAIDVPDRQKHRTILLLTDGIPNVMPPRGHIPTLQRYLEEIPNGNSITIDTFGFGYQLDSQLLDEIAIVGNGKFVFIPDGTFVGTAFINACSNMLATAVPNVYCNGKSIGLLQHGKQRNIAFVDNVIITESEDYSVIEDVSESEIEYHRLRQLFVETIRKALDMSLQNAQFEIQNLTAAIRRSPYATDYRVAALLQDVEGQVTEAFSRADWFDKWGKHYSRSLSRAHELQQCHNFRDPGVQYYGGELFNVLRDAAEKIFESIPPPQPSVRNYSSRPQSNLQSMATYNSRSGPCFYNKCRIKTATGYMKLSELKIGDLVATPNGDSPIEYIVETSFSRGIAELVRVGTLLVTPTHPIMHEKKWVWPKSLYPVDNVRCDSVINLVIKNRQPVYVENIECSTLAHGLKGGIIEHSFYGTEKVTENLSRISNGNRHIRLREGCARRNANGDVFKLVL